MFDRRYGAAETLIMAILRPYLSPDIPVYPEGALRETMQAVV